MKRIAIILSSALAIIACGEKTDHAQPGMQQAAAPAAKAAPAETPASAPSKEETRCVTGTKLDAAGGVAEPKTTFAAADSIYLTVQLASKPRAPELTVEILDEHAEEMKTLFADLTKNSTGNIVTFPVRNLTEGRYTAKASVDKKQVCEVAFEIR